VICLDLLCVFDERRKRELDFLWLLAGVRLADRTHHELPARLSLQGCAGANAGIIINECFRYRLALMNTLQKQLCDDRQSVCW
jgi:hypothetical protein